MRNLNELEIRGTHRRPPTDDQIKRFEAHFGIRLPKDLITLLNVKNGGSPEPATFQPKGIKKPSPHVVNEFCFLNDNKTDPEGMWDSTEVWRQATDRNVVAIGQSTADDGILLLYDKKSPSVALCIHDEAPNLIHVADSFSEFIDLLGPSTETPVLAISDKPHNVGGRDLRELKLADPYGGCPTATDVNDFESKYGFVLPPDYLTFLRFANGGTPQVNTFTPEKSGSKKSYQVELFYFLNDVDDRDASFSLWNELVNWRGNLGKTAVPIATTPDSNPIFLSYDTQPPSVKMWLDDGRIIDVAKSFSDFISLLRAPEKKSRRS